MTWDLAAAARLGRVLRDLRLSAKLTQQELAELAGITKNQLQLIEAGRAAAGATTGPSNPRMSTLAGLCAVFGISVAELLAAAEV